MAQRPQSRASGTTKRTLKDSQPVNDVRAKPAPSAPGSLQDRLPSVDDGTTSGGVREAKPKRKDTGKRASRSGEAAAAPNAAVPRSASVDKTTPERQPSAPDDGRADAAPAVVKPKRTRKTKSVEEKPAGTAVRRASRARKNQPPTPPYLAAELGQPVDEAGEPIGAGSARLRSDRQLQDYALQLWRQMQRGGEARSHLRSIERAGLTIDDIWTAGITDMQPTSSTPDEMRRYRQKVLFRANLLEAMLSETVADLHRLEGIEPLPAQPASEPG